MNGLTHYGRPVHHCLILLRFFCTEMRKVFDKIFRSQTSAHVLLSLSQGYQSLACCSYGGLLSVMKGHAAPHTHQLMQILPRSRHLLLSSEVLIINPLAKKKKQNKKTQPHGQRSTLTVSRGVVIIHSGFIDDLVFG